MARDDFVGQSGGGGVNDFEFTVTDAWFGKSEAFSDKTGLETIFMHWVGTTDLEDERFTQLTEESFHPSWALGTDWEAVESGKKARYDGPSKKPRFGKWYGRLCDTVLDITDHVAGTDQDPLGGDAHPSDASIWIGTKWFMQDVEFPTLKNPNTGEVVSHLMPTQYLGRGDTTVAASPSSSAASPQPDAAASNGLRPQVEALAKSASSYGEFQAAALALPGVSADPALVLEIADEAKLYTAVRG